ncbi:hypothetical protein JCGZ_18351 [Jatropha curcas]|uniref:KIB1-4 beta-propeller domain-containing protein n=1 Tax=Jatropha curcas TaxID=180498 RepID=A0A067KAZ1_JATCU|nr:hypothetical protein JCGZ_18351 [Jatropha curcas]
MRFETMDDYSTFMSNRKLKQIFHRKLQLHFNTDKELLLPLDVHKIAISSPPNEDNCTAMIIYNHHSDLAFCRIGDSSWTALGNQFVIPFHDIIYSSKRQLFYAITVIGNVQAWDLRDPSLPISKVIKYTYMHPSLEHPEEISRVEYERCRYLVELPEGDFLIVIRYQSSIQEDGSLFYPESMDIRSSSSCKTIWFDLRKLDVEKQTLEPVNHLGDDVLFLGANESFCLSARDYPGLRPNCIYFSNDPPGMYMYKGKPYRGYDIGVYSLEDFSISSLHPFELHKIQPALWVFPRP